MAKAQLEKMNSKISGSLLGGAIGDALGYAIEFSDEQAIQEKYGFVKTFVGEPKISDDTQMSLYTAVNYVFALTRGAVRGIGGDPRDMAYLASSYLRWYEGQIGIKDGAYPSFLRYVSHFNEQRAPGNTCLSALAKYRETKKYATIDEPFNTSKGCGGVMRVAPTGLYFAWLNAAGYPVDAFDAAKTGADAAALTHGHELGYIPAAFLSCLIYQIVSPYCMGDLEELVFKSMAITKSLFGKKKHWNEFETIIDRAVDLAKDTNVKEIEAIHERGEGWGGEEAVAIALYCCLRHKDSFGDAVRFAVNHKGDSDSTGAIAGNIIGAYLGLGNIKTTFPDYWKVEFYDLIMEIAADLTCSIPTNSESKQDLWWFAKYECNAPREVIANHWPRYRTDLPIE